MAKRNRKSKKPTIDDIQADCKFIVPLYGGTVFVFRSREALHDARALLGRPYEDDHANAGCCEMFESTHDGRALYLVGLFVDAASVLAHEVTHLALSIADRAGFDPLNEQEPLAYLIEELFGRIAGEYD